MAGIESINLSVFRAINHLAGSNGLLDSLAVFFAKYLIFFFLLWLIFLWLKKKGRYRNIILFSLLSGLLGTALNFLIRLFYFHPRPFALGLGTTLIRHIPEASFPSGHTTLMLSLALIFFYFRETRVVGAVLFVLGLVGGLARVFSGIHFPLDILGSVIVALVGSLFIYQARGLIRRVFVSLARRKQG